MGGTVVDIRGGTGRVVGWRTALAFYLWEIKGQWPLQTCE